MKTDGDDTARTRQSSAERSPKVLLVDDDELLLSRLESLITAAGFEVSTARDGAAALATLKREFAAIVILDRNMPGMEGLTLCRAIRQDSFQSYVYLIVLTDQDSEDDVLAGFDAGADEYLSRRASPGVLLARLRTAQRILTLEGSLRAMAEERRRLAMTDALTGAHNRLYFTRHLAREIKRTHRYGGELSLIAIDIDQFQLVNDQYGHAGGDAVLQELVRRIYRCLPRDYDWCARLSGEEFAVVLPQTALEGAVIVAEKLRHTIEIEPMLTGVDGGSAQVTVSLGVSGLEAVPERAGATPESLLAHADRLLYRGKQAGRNRVVAANRIVAG
jgi:diguanylate cyclase (GGDEF)-like protein